ncbi:fasciclin-1-like isoform X2 [Mizuhopecten yessoensis]|uniref:Periostin n=1 Tax=Mizuhopecten yessoensis TaxID=6573 RepID=A0A210R5J5_MIZYE|nr:fasciclin-1-like isoform X2 [Mizuhopecten yessoensis]XP_021351774.1 fasciclin-1-like isoform X2 [Mizuhopecten yessoensis]OWF56282.1 Periostin [Mizuhopecten yessoensis]
MVLCPSFTHVWILIVLMFAKLEQSHGATVWELIQENNQLRELHSFIRQQNMSRLFEQTGITVFAPYSTAFLYYDEMHYGYNMADPKMAESFLSFHIAQGIIHESDIVDNRATDSTHSSNAKLHFNTFTDGDDLVKSVNGAVLLNVDIVASNGVLHIIDKVIAPIASNRTLHDYMLKPEMPNLSFVSVTRASIVDMGLKNRTRNNNYQFTAFAPNDSVLFPMPAYGQDVLFGDAFLLRSVIQAHMIPDYVQFLPSRGTVLPRVATAGAVKFERRNGELYVMNNKVRARVVDANIPVSNGVIHVIDNLLYFVYMNIVQKLQEMSETRKALGLYLDKLPLSTKTILASTNKKFTIFAPTDEAFAKIPRLDQEELSNDLSLLSEVLETHIIPDVEIVGYNIPRYDELTSINNNTIRVLQVNNEVYVEAGGVQARVEMADIKCTNGIIHLISNVLLIRNFSIWDAISGNAQLQYAANMISKDPTLQSILSGTAAGYGQLTMFIPGDAGIFKIPERTRNYFSSDPNVVIEAFRGHLFRGELPSYDVTSMIVKKTISDKDIEIEILKGFGVTGSHIFAKVVVMDILCSNGVIHIIDDLLHVPTRNILEQMARYTDLEFQTSFYSMPKMSSLRSKLWTEDVFFTVFVPVDDAFDVVPRSRVDKMLQDEPYMEKILKAHVVPNMSLYAEDFSDGDLLLAEEEFIHIFREGSDDVVIINNNVKAKILKSNIRATNGKLHVIDRLLYFPYLTVAETMAKDPRFSAFYDLMSLLVEFQLMAADDGQQMTIFVPSSTFLASISTNESSAILANPEILRKIFIGHVIPGARLDSMYLRQKFVSEYVYTGQNSSTFKFEDETQGVTISAGYSNLHQPLDIVRDGVACSNGILYTIDGFLSWSLLNIRQELESDATLNDTAQRFMDFLPDDVEDIFADEGQIYTLFLPEEAALQNIKNDFRPNVTDKEGVYRRHVINGSMVTLADFIQKGNSSHNDTTRVDNIVRGEDCFLLWNEIETKIIKSNILAKNGIIHIVDKMLLSIPEPEITSRKGALEPGVGGAVVIKTNIILLLVTCSISLLSIFVKR